MMGKENLTACDGITRLKKGEKPKNEHLDEISKILSMHRKSPPPFFSEREREQERRKDLLGQQIPKPNPCKSTL